GREAMGGGREERIQRAGGGLEPADDVYNAIRIAYPAAFLVMLGENIVRGGPSALAMTAGLTLFVFAKALKWWAIVTLGPAWTFRVIVVPGAPLVAGGPYP